MSLSEVWPWLALFGLGTFHGVNPGMGWLFAVALGLQEKSRRAVLRALVPITVGHAASIGLVLVPVGLMQVLLPHALLRLLAAVTLVGFGVYRLVRSRHPRWGGMRVSLRGLTFWSFLMASAHGAGLMVIPIVLGWPQEGNMPHGHQGQQLSHWFFQEALSAVASSSPWLAVVGVHSAGYLLVTGLVALVVYEKLGLTLLRHAWFNLDLLWAIALIAAGLFTQLF